MSSQDSIYDDMFQYTVRIQYPEEFDDPLPRGASAYRFVGGNILKHYNDMENEELEELEDMIYFLRNAKDYFLPKDSGPKWLNEAKKKMANKVIIVDYNKDPEWFCYESGDSRSCTMKIAGIDEPLKIQYVIHRSKYTYTAYMTIKCGEMVLSTGEGDYYNNESKDEEDLIELLKKNLDLPISHILCTLLDGLEKNNLHDHIMGEYGECDE